MTETSTVIPWYTSNQFTIFRLYEMHKLPYLRVYKPHLDF
jgi:hypothetical protein